MGPTVSDTSTTTKGCDMDMLLLGGLWLGPEAWASTTEALAERGHRGIPVTLPGQGDGADDATLDDQVDAVVAAIDGLEGPCMLVGHSASCGLAWIATDRRPDRLAKTVLVGGFAPADGETYADFFPMVDGAMPFPGWEPFAGPDSDDLDDEAKARFQEAAIAVPKGVAQGTVRLADERRYDVPLVLVCPEYSPDDVKGWIAAGDAPELAAARHVSFVDIDTGHWPMVSAPVVLADALASLA